MVLITFAMQNGPIINKELLGFRNTYIYVLLLINYMYVISRFWKKKQNIRFNKNNEVVLIFS